LASATSSETLATIDAEEKISLMNELAAAVELPARGRVSEIKTVLSSGLR